jgi:hypothetical protein
MCAKVEDVAAMATLAVENKKCVVIGMQSTGEASLDQAIVDGHVSINSGTDDLPSVAESHMLKAIALLKHPEFPQDEASRRSQEILVGRAKAICLPPNALDDLIDRCGGPSVVAEMTGRTNRLVRDNGAGQFWLKKRCAPSDTKVNIVERDKFQAGVKLIGIISDAASTGVRLFLFSSFPPSLITTCSALAWSWVEQSTL